MLSSPRPQSLCLCAFRENKGSSEVDDIEDKLENMDTITNSTRCDSLDMKGGHINDVFMTEDERLTPLWATAVCFFRKPNTCFCVTTKHSKISRADYIFYFTILVFEAVSTVLESDKQSIIPIKTTEIVSYWLFRIFESSFLIIQYVNVVMWCL